MMKENQSFEKGGKWRIEDRQSPERKEGIQDQVQKPTLILWKERSTGEIKVSWDINSDLEIALEQGELDTNNPQEFVELPYGAGIPDAYYGADISRIDEILAKGDDIIIEPNKIKERTGLRGALVTLGHSELGDDHSYRIVRPPVLYIYKEGGVLMQSWEKPAEGYFGMKAYDLEFKLARNLTLSEVLELQATFPFLKVKIRPNLEIELLDARELPEHFKNKYL